MENSQIKKVSITGAGAVGRAYCRALVPAGYESI